ncbi:epoxyqueuosine reductase QueH [Desulfonatronum thioautotrophicum]|uniref:epoxyqueuosine reductase QueH n=1 Tax=Desulfonatronum thioautotrophicum TaxID=617001 RepID=UPI0009FDA5DD|nr:epoxyqueuosine reductase QueH [Desulfonatronum thioautotrophicum]
MSGIAQPATLLHVCCGPCALMPVQYLRETGQQVTGFFFNPNIHGVQEYFQRREAALQAADELDLPLVCLDGEYDPRRFFQAVHGREDRRCPSCYRLRLERTFAFAHEHGFPSVSTTLLYSIHQDRETLLVLGRELEERTGIVFLANDFRPGWQAGIDLSKRLGLYRQSYCGCLYSEVDRRRKKLNRLASSDRPSNRSRLGAAGVVPGAG